MGFEQGICISKRVATKILCSGSRIFLILAIFVFDACSVIENFIINNGSWCRSIIIALHLFLI